MMTRLERYLFRNLLVATLYAIVGLTVTIWLTRSLRLIEIVVEAGAPLRLFLWLLFLSVPTFLGVVLPVALVGAVLFTYNRLTMDSELVVMRAAGVGPLRLARPALLLAVAVIGVSFVLNLWLTPAAHRELVHMEYAVKNDYSQLFLREGVFNDVADRLSVYVRERDREGNLHGVLIHDARVKEKAVTIMGERAVMVPGEGGARFVVFDGNRQEMDRATKRLSELYFERYAVDIKLLSNTAMRWPDARERTMAELFDPPANLQGQDRLLGQMRSELHHRLSSPLLSLAFTMVALACLLSGEFNRRGQGIRIALAIGIVVLLQAVAVGFTSMAGRSGGIIPLMYLMPLLSIIPAAWALVLGLPRRRRAVSSTAA